MRGNQKDLRTTGFFHGSQGIPAETGIGEITAAFEAESSRVREASVETEKRAEAEASGLENARALNEAEWEILRARAGENIPNRFIPLVFLGLTASAAVADVVLLAPMADALAIADQAHQVYAAIAFVTVGGMSIEGLRALLNRTLNPDMRVAPEAKLGMGLRLGSAFLVFLCLAITLFSIGMWRAEVLRYGNESGWLANLLRACGPLTSTMIVSFNLGLAVVTAFFSHWFEKLVFAGAWHRAKRNLKTIPERIAKTRKRIEAIRKRLEHRLDAIAAKREKWAQAYLQHYADGRANGTLQFPMSLIWLKVGVALLFAFIALVYATRPFDLDDVTRWLTVVPGAVSVAGFVGYHAYLSRLFPTPTQIYRWRVTHRGPQSIADKFTRDLSLSINPAPPSGGEIALPPSDAVAPAPVRAVNGIHSN